MKRITSFAILLAAMTGPASAYIGPGAGAGAIATVLGVLGAIVLLIVGFLWYPVKRLLKRGKSDAPEASADKQ